jgi:putative sigma-54 modulation protein
MITKLEIAGIHMSVDDNLKRYVTKKIGECDRFLPRRLRPSLHAEVSLKEVRAQDKKNCICEVVLYLPHEVITSTESTINMYAAVDIVETKLQTQLRKYKQLHTDPKFYRRMLSRLSKAES